MNIKRKEEICNPLRVRKGNSEGAEIRGKGRLSGIHAEEELNDSQHAIAAGVMSYVNLSA